MNVASQIYDNVVLSPYSIDPTDYPWPTPPTPYPYTGSYYYYAYDVLVNPQSGQSATAYDDVYTGTAFWGVENIAAWDTDEPADGQSAYGQKMRVWGPVTGLLTTYINVPQGSTIASTSYTDASVITIAEGGYYDFIPPAQTYENLQVNVYCFWPNITDVSDLPSVNVGSSCA